ncbi:MAG: ATP-binding protein [Bdellovibrionales bacterium]
MTRHESIWKRLRSFDYTELSFLYIACLVTIAVVYSVFRASQYELGHEELKAIHLLRALDQQRDGLLKMDRLVANPRLRNREETVEAYVTVSENHLRLRPLIHDLKEFQQKCRHRPCAELLKPEAFEKITDSTEPYHAALRDAFILSEDILQNRSEAKMTFDLISYFALLILLLIQAVYVFRPAIQRLNASLSTRADFLSRISHEIRNPMNSILGMADILKGTRLNFEQKQYVENLARSGRALLDMLDNLIDISSLERGKLQLKPREFDLFESLDRCMNLIAVPAHHKNLNIYLCIDPRVQSALVGDAIRLEQVLINLLNNAVKFTDQGTITITVDVEREEESSLLLYFSVIDTGIGIRSDLHSAIFESFVQADSSIQRKYGGSGLGLSISSEIVRLMGGELKVSSRPGEGSCFYFRVKMETQSGFVQAPAPLQPLKDYRFVYVLAPQDATASRSFFSRLHCSACFFHSAKELRQWFEPEAQPNVHEVLIDDSLGIIAMINCRNIAEANGQGERAVAVIRSNFTKENMDLLQRNGFTRFLIKPLKPWELLHLPTRMMAEVEPKTLVLNSHAALLAKLKEMKLQILLVDDSNDNLFLLKEVISPVAASMHFAENGLEAVEKFGRNPYDVVFMDIQMPVMDGYTAIRKMREWERARGKSPIPIYAVTAHAGLVDAQKCREAGFTDRIVKPVVRNDIYGSLSRSFGLDVPEVDESGGPTLPGAYIAKLIPTYLKARLEDMDRLRLALQTQDFQSVSRLGHKMKGSAANYGFAQVGELSRELELAAQAEDLQRCTQLAEQLDHTFSTTPVRSDPSPPSQ